jgi:hypothetical protein
MGKLKLLPALTEKIPIDIIPENEICRIAPDDERL